MRSPVFISFDRIKKKDKTILAIFLSCVFLVSLCSCMKDNGNRPYEPDGPTPDPHDGVFVCEGSSLTFNGDGKTIILSLKKEICGLFELEEGNYEGTYVFLSGDLPPHGSSPIRYDAAHEFKIDLPDGYSRTISLGVVSADGKTASVSVGAVTKDQIPLVFEEEGKLIQLEFKKE